MSCIAPCLTCCSHLTQSGDIGPFSIISEESIAKGIRRIVGATGQTAVQARALAASLESQIQEEGATLENVKHWTATVDTAYVPLVDKDRLRKKGLYAINVLSVLSLCSACHQGQARRCRQEAQGCPRCQCRAAR